MCGAIGHVRFAPNSDIDCVRRHVRFAPKAETVICTRRCENHHNVGSPDDRAGLKPAITLSRKDWLFRANRALVWPVPVDRHVPGSCPAGSMAEVGLRWWRRKTPWKPKEIPMNKSNSKRRTLSRSSSRKTAKQNNAVAQTTTHKLVKPKRGTQPQPDPSSAKQTERTETKQGRILAMLRAPSGVTIDAIMHATGWQQHQTASCIRSTEKNFLPSPSHQERDFSAWRPCP